jgi:hypothetical protein
MLPPGAVATFVDTGGSLPYLAPEIIRLMRGGPKEPYNEKCSQGPAIFVSKHCESLLGLMPYGILWLAFIYRYFYIGILYVFLHGWFYAFFQDFFLFFNDKLKNACPKMSISHCL